jgi:hypothetical protein
MCREATKMIEAAAPRDIRDIRLSRRSQQLELRALETNISKDIRWLLIKKSAELSLQSAPAHPTIGGQFIRGPTANGVGCKKIKRNLHRARQQAGRHDRSFPRKVRCKRLAILARSGQA